jgi:predicted transcriptional regulator of viral defense system
LAGGVDPGDVQRQLARWTRAGRVLQLRRGLYTLAPPFRKVVPHPFVVANRLVRGSYVSLESALAHHGVIPEHVPATTSVGIGRPASFRTPLGAHHFRHIHMGLLWGYQAVDVGVGQEAFIATPEKALLDLVHLRSGGDRPEFLGELRLQNLDRLDIARLAVMAERAGSPKLGRAAARITELARREAEEYESL